MIYLKSVTEEDGERHIPSTGSLPRLAAVVRAGPGC